MHLGAGRTRPAERLLESGLGYLADAPREVEGIPVAALVAAARPLLSALGEGGGIPSGRERDLTLP